MRARSPTGHTSTPTSSRSSRSPTTTPPTTSPTWGRRRACAPHRVLLPTVSGAARYLGRLVACASVLEVPRAFGRALFASTTGRHGRAHPHGGRCSVEESVCERESVTEAVFAVGRREGRTRTGMCSGTPRAKLKRPSPRSAPAPPRSSASSALLLARPHDSETMILGLILALASALATNLAFLFKHRGAVLAPPVRVRQPVRSAAGLLRSRWFLVG
jgi:hypothetical protein